MRLLDEVYAKTQEYLQTVSKAARKMIGQFFTPITIADYMGKMQSYQVQKII